MALLKFSKFWHIVFHTVWINILLACTVLGVIIFSIAQTLPDVSDPLSLLAKESMVIQDRFGRELYRFYTEQDRTVVTVDQVPEHLLHAIIAIEDKRFYSRSCIDTRALGRAILANVTRLKSQGGSTITQQLARTALLTRSKTFERKAREILLACQMEQQYSKDEIIEMYLNWIAFGHGIAGVEQASQRYFGVHVSELSLAQSAVLASLPQRPTYFSPYGPHKHTTVSNSLRKAIRNEEIQNAEQIQKQDLIIGLLGTTARLGDGRIRLPGRADIVLQAMYNQGHISTEDYQAASTELARINFIEPTLSLIAPHFVLTLKNETEQWMALQNSTLLQGGIRIHSTIDKDIQALAEQIVTTYVQSKGEKFGFHNASLLAVDTKTNQIVAYVGNANFYDDVHSGQFDMVRVPRQTGSAFKPFVYAALLEQGYTSESVIHDYPLDPKLYRAHKSGYYGRMTLATALARSRNVPAIRAFFMAGGEDIILELADRLGVGTPKWYKQTQRPLFSRFQYGWPLALGSAESSLLEMLQGYSVFANNGSFTTITGIESIQNQQGDILFQPKVDRVQVIQKSTATQMTAMLSSSEAREPDWRYGMSLPFGTAAVKTGTSNICLQRDASDTCTHVVPNNTWAIGYTGDLLVGVWVGNANNAPMVHDSPAVDSALPLWKEFMVQVHSTSLHSFASLPQ